MIESAKELSSKQVFELLDHLVSLPRTGGHIIRPLFIWGKPGLGKTEMIRDYAHEHNMQFCYVAPAQFEEMGDLHGIPEVENKTTVFRKPSWLPNSDGRPGIMLLDDINRADPRIIGGIMQLAQLHKLMSWELPDNWTIVCTGNPGNLQNSDVEVTKLDDAFMTRFIHVKVYFEKMEWAQWAEKNGIHKTAINFVLTHPEVITKGKMTNARTIASFFHLIAPFKNWLDEPMVEILGYGLLDDTTVKLFIHFLKTEAEHIPEPETILFSNETDKLVEDLRKMIKHQNIQRLDLFHTAFSRLLVTCRRGVRKKVNKDNIVALFTLPEIPNDMRTSMIFEWNKLAQENLVEILSDSRISKSFRKAA